MTADGSHLVCRFGGAMAWLLLVSQRGRGAVDQRTPRGPNGPNIRTDFNINDRAEIWILCILGAVFEMQIGNLKAKFINGVRLHILEA